MGVTAGDELPIEGYDEILVKKVSERLDGLSVEKMERLRVHEEKNKNRKPFLQ